MLHKAVFSTGQKKLRTQKNTCSMLLFHSPMVPLLQSLISSSRPILSVFSHFSLSECFVSSVSHKASMPPPLLDPPPFSSHAPSSSSPPPFQYPLIGSVIAPRFLFLVLSSCRHHHRPLHHERCVWNSFPRSPSNSIRFLCAGLALVVDVLWFVQVE
jgi:hypothetical protein